MVYSRWIELYKNKSLSSDEGTESFDIKRNEQILELLLVVRAKNGATTNSPDAKALETIEKAIKKIEITSGSYTLKSYTGEICRKIATYRNGVLPHTLYTQAAGSTYVNNDPTSGWQEYAFPIYFTTKCDPYGDRTRTLLPAPLFDVLTLTLEYDFTISATEGFVTGGSNHIFDLYAHVVPKYSVERMLRSNILQETKKQDYTSVASGDEPFKLTIAKNKSLRHLYVFAYENGVSEGVDITDLKLKVDGHTYMASNWGRLQVQNALDARLRYEQDMYLVAQTTTDELWTRVPSPIVSITPGTSPTTAPYFTALGNGDKVTVTTDSAGDVNIMKLTSNVLPATTVFDLDKDCTLNHVQTCNVNDLELILTNGGAGASVQIIEQHIHHIKDLEDVR